MTLKPILMATGMSLALLVTSGTGAADVKSMAADAAKDQAADLAKEKATDMAKDQAGAIMPATGGAAMPGAGPELEKLSRAVICDFSNIAADQSSQKSLKRLLDSSV